MYAVVRTGGKQYRVEPGNTVDIELVEGTVGETVTFSDVLLVENGGKVQIGRPTVKGATVLATITARKRGPKLTIFKKLRRHGQQLKKGHRQELMTVRVDSIAGV